MKLAAWFMFMFAVASATASPVTGQFTLTAKSGSGFGILFPDNASPSTVPPGSYTGSLVVDSALLGLANGSYDGSSYISAFSVQIDAVKFDIATSTSNIRTVVVTDHQISGLNIELVSNQPVANGSTPVLSISGNGYWDARVMFTNRGYSANTVRGDLGSAHYNVAVVPEPETYGMMLVGIGLVGFAVRRNKACT